MFEYVLFLFSVVLFFILIRETIIDIKTMYVPDNITFALYTTAVLFLLGSWITTGSLQTVKEGFFGFLLGFGVPFAISFLSYIIRLAIYKAQKRKDVPEESSPLPQQEPVNQTKSSSSKQRKTKRIIYWILCLLFVAGVSFSQTLIPSSLYLGISLLAWGMAVFSYEKTKNINFPLYIAGVALMVLALIVKKEPHYILLTIGAVGLEWLLARLYRRFYKIEEESDDAKSGEEAIEGGIGGGDILIFGALGLMFGIKGVIMILIYSVFCQFLVIFSYFILSKEKVAFGYAPFVPGIALGVYCYTMGFDLLNIQQVLSFFWGV